MGLLSWIYHHKWLLTGSALAVYAVCTAKAYYRLSQFKGPFSTGFSQIWHVRALLSWKPHAKYREVCDKYGSIARIGPNDLVTSSPELIFHMNSARSAYTRGDYYYRASRFEAGKDHVFSEIDEDKHKRRRQQLAAGYSGKDNPDLEVAVDTHITELIQLVRSKYLSIDAHSTSFDFARKVQYFTLDVISNISFSIPFGHLRADADVDAIVESGEVGMMLSALSVAFSLTKLLQIPLIFKLIGPSEKDPVGMGKMVANARTIVRRRLAQGTSEKTDMIASFFRHGLKEEDLISETCLQIIAGSDTTSASLRGIFLYLLSHPRVYRNLQAEIDTAVRDGRVSSGIASNAQCKKLPYLQAVIKEANRMHPPVTSQLPKRVPDGGDTITIDGETVFLPGGTHICYSMVALNRRKDVFGGDADEFRPERWLIEDGEKLNCMTRAHEVIFGHGKNGCLGKTIALMELSKAVFELVRNFDWSLASPEKPWIEHNYAGLYVHSGMWVTAMERAV